MELRALYTDRAIYFLAQWTGEPPSGEDITANKLTVHWRVPGAERRGLSCNVVCHTAFADGNGTIAYVNAETIPSAGDESLLSAGSWVDGRWTLEWTRPLVTENPFDLEFDDLELAYPFMIKIFEGREGQPDPLSQLSQLAFSR